MRKVHYWLVVILLSSAVFVLDTRGSADRIPARETLASFPPEIGNWSGTDLAIDQEVRSVLGPGDFLSRDYTAPGSLHPINLFIGYFPSQRTGDTIHSPMNCLPGGGWVFESSKHLDLKDALGKEHRVGEYIIANGDTKDFVIYWYQSHGRSVASEYAARAYMVADAVRMHRSDAALVRIITPIGPEETASVARKRAEAFTAELAPLLPRFIPN